jgi:hypothetical protein
MAATSDEEQVFQLGVDAGRMLLNMPVNHDAFTAVAHVPLRHGLPIANGQLWNAFHNCPYGMRIIMEG